MLGKARRVLPNAEKLERSSKFTAYHSMGSPGSDEDDNQKSWISYQDKKYLGNSEVKLLKKSSIEWDLAVTPRCKRMGLGGSGLTHTWLACLSNRSLLSKCPAVRFGV